MPTQIATSTASTATAYSNQRKIDRTSNGVLLAVHVYQDAGVSNRLAWTCSTDEGVTWSSPVIFAGPGTGYTVNASLFIDQDDYAHVVYKDGSDGYIYYRRGTPNAARTDWTWSAAQLIGGSTTYDYADVVAHREGTGWVAHIVGSQLVSSTDTRVRYARVAISNTGTLTVSDFVAFTNLGGGYSANVHTYPSIDFNHTGDGKTVAGGTPHLYAAWSAGATGAGKGIRFKKATYSGGTWTWGTEREIDSTRTQNADSQWLNCLFDGTRVIIGGFIVGTNLDLVLYERNAADTATVVRELLLNPITAERLYWGSMSYDLGGNVHIIGVNSDESAGSRDLVTRKWDRGSGNLSAETIIDSNTGSFPYVSAKRGYSNNRIEFIYTDGTASPYSVSYDSISLNQPPNAAVITSMVNGQKVDIASTNRGTWNFSDPDLGDTQSKADIRYRLVGSSTWTTLTYTGPNNFYDFPASTFAVDDYEWQVLTYDAQGVAAAAWSELAFFSGANAPPEPVITDPVNNGTVSTEYYTVKWSAPSQSKYQVQILDDVDAVIFDSGSVGSSTLRSHYLHFPDNGTTRKIRVRIESSGLWSPWTTITVTVSYTSPAPFTVSITAVDRSGIGVAHVLTVDSDHPAPTGSQPTVTFEEVFVREVGESGAGIRVCSNCPPSQAFSYLSPAATVSYEFRVKANGDNETSTWSEWTAAPIVNFDGVLIHDPLDHDGSLLYAIHNSQGASDSFEVEHATVAYQGREFPVVEFGDASEHTVEVGLIQSLSGESAALRELVKRRTILCYRDSVGRKVYGVVGINVIADAVYGSDTSVSFTEVDYSEAV